jgi:hypothetical protein
MATKKISLNELRSLVKQIIKEEKNIDRDVFTIRKNQTYFGHVTKEGNQYVTWGQIGDGNKYNSLEDVFKELQGFDIHLDDIFWD